MSENNEEDTEENDEDYETKSKYKDYLERKLTLKQNELMAKNMANRMSTPSTYHYMGKPFDEDHVFNERRKLSQRDLPLSRKPKTNQVKGILDIKQLVGLGVGIFVVLLFISGILSVSNIGTGEWKLPEWKLPEAEEGSTHIKKTIEDLTRWTNKQNEENRWKRFDSYETVLSKKPMVDGMDCTQLIDFMLANTRSEFQAYSAFLILERGCVIP